MCERLRAQTHASAELINRWGFEFPEAARLLNNAGSYMSQRGNYTEAEPLLERSLAIWEKALGPEHPDVAQNLNNLALLYHAQGRYEKAEPLLERSLAIWKKSLGPEHPDVAQSLNNLANLYDAQGRYKKAEPLYEPHNFINICIVYSNLERTMHASPRAVVTRTARSAARIAY